MGRAGLAEICRLLLDAGFTPIDPFMIAPHEDIARINALPSLDAQREAWRPLNAFIGENSANTIGVCEGVLAILDGPDVHSGTAAEIGFAFAKGKPIVGYRGDFRLAADNIGSAINLQVENFITASGVSIVTAIGEAAPALQTAIRAKLRNA